MGNVNCYCNFIPNYSQLVSPLNQLRRRSFLSFEEAYPRRYWASTFQRKSSACLTTDASSFGIGFVLSHIHPDGKEKPIAKTLDVHQVRMKKLARQHVWWPGIDDDIAQLTKSCTVCKVGNPAPVKGATHRSKVWQQIGKCGDNFG